MQGIRKFLFDRATCVALLIGALMSAIPRPGGGEPLPSEPPADGASSGAALERCFAPTSSGWEDLRAMVFGHGPTFRLEIAGIPAGSRVRVDLDGEQIAEHMSASTDLILEAEHFLRREYNKIRLFAVGTGHLPPIEEVGCWIYRRRLRGRILQVEGESDLSVELGVQMVDESGGGSEGEGLIVTSFGFHTAVSGDWWELTARVAQAHGEPFGRRTFSRGLAMTPGLGSFLIEGTLLSSSRIAGPMSNERLRLQLSFGDQDFGRRLWGLERSVIFGSFFRRGFLARFDTAKSGFRLGGFLTTPRPDDSWGSSERLDDPRHQLAGTVASYRRTPPGADLQIAAVYLDGETSGELGAGEAGVASPSASSLWGLSTRVSLFDHRFAVWGELARSRHDPDGVGTEGIESAAVSRRDDALAFGLELSSHGHRGSRNDPSWWLGLDRSRVGLFYRSLAHPALATDRDTEVGFLGGAWQGFEGELKVRRDHDNVNELEALPRTETTSSSLSLSYRPAFRSDSSPTRLSGDSGWVRPQVVTLMLSRQDDRSPGSSGPDSGALDRSVRSLFFSAHGRHWNLRYSHDEYGGFSPSGLRIVSELVGLGWNLRLAGWHFEPSIQASRFESQVSSETRLLRLTVRRPFRKLRSVLRADVQQREVDGDETVESLSLAADLGWRIREPKGLRPGFELWLHSLYNDEDSMGAGGLGIEDPRLSSATQIFLGARLTWKGVW